MEIEGARRREAGKFGKGGEISLEGMATPKPVKGKAYGWWLFCVQRAPILGQYRVRHGKGIISEVPTAIVS